MEIRRLIGSMNISSQEELLRLLEKQGFEMTQATLGQQNLFYRLTITELLEDLLTACLNVHTQNPVRHR